MDDTPAPVAPWESALPSALREFMRLVAEDDRATWRIAQLRLDRNAWENEGWLLKQRDADLRERWEIRHEADCLPGQKPRPWPWPAMRAVGGSR